MLNYINEINSFEIWVVLQIVVAILLGGILGWQREQRGKHAGPRTYALVTSGAALFTALSIHAFGNNMAPVAAGIVTGIGFLGAGMILHHENQIEGLTTAAGLWMTAAIGMAIGVGYYFLAVCTTVLILLVLMLNDQKFKKEIKE
ncbi:MAG: MgtC family protein [Candidatus Magasanikbacteria bacterium GW2011_GWA2_37_8]|uniref:MgtC family protein n=1 Tax=Candidatus Magasanikbacteria bacterium GW2011_GWA2_37_8 TaxID=1619036 RepID=A0A0G0HNP0_9BACT|nr:MAG: MgtC family protein [Candidatus Magasanikbacteria bacterium GW2011_GWA2_37_8]